MAEPFSLYVDVEITPSADECYADFPDVEVGFQPELRLGELLGAVPMRGVIRAGLSNA
ncbi:hypothetical protein [Dankookia rubra]|uniref:hypothetical protein n=1 Tax=Dankookia rubra TaxID=1442381 RepID=UPI00140D6725|nr:hypothetical protein [Dankookia rubra]